MQALRKPFKVSTGLKDLIGRDLITNDFVAVFELVKNSFDAHAKTVRIHFEEDRIVIADNGKGMSQADILNKWLFVAYSAKREDTEDKDYRHKISERKRPYAGAKGVWQIFVRPAWGLSSRSVHELEGSRVQVLDIDWTRYEKDAKQEFGKIKVEITQTLDFFEPALKPEGSTGTVLEIRSLRSEWKRDKLQTLKGDLAKLINPFSVGPLKFQIDLVVPAERAADKLEMIHSTRRSGDIKTQLPVNGKIENRILEILKHRTTSIHVFVVNNGNTIETILEDRGDKIYRIRESSPYKGLEDTGFEAELFFLNRSAKAVFARRMGLASVQFGSIFLFRNGFRVFPIGEEHDDFFGLQHRKQQGQRRYLGSRDLIGRVELNGVEGFNEATSRDQGLIRTPQVEELITCVLNKCVRRLERYVVDITWKDLFDKDKDDTSRMKLDESSALIGASRVTVGCYRRGGTDRIQP